MKVNKSEGKSFKETILAATMIVGASTLLFQGFTHVATAAEFNKTNIIPTSYANYAAESSKAVKSSLPEGYKKANYTVGAIDLEYYRKQTPTSKDMTKEAAAEIGAQALWEIFDLSLEGKVIEMGYDQAIQSFHRSNWCADVLINGKRSYFFSVDSVTGELFSIGRSRTLNEKVSVAFDAALDKNHQEYVELARKLAEKYNIVHGKVKSVEYKGQGYSNNDPDISFDITGENGEIALMTFSRYDKALLGICYNTEYKSALEKARKYEKEVQAKAEKHRQSALPTDKNETPSFIILD